jgi:hypothetical protein
VTIVRLEEVPPSLGHPAEKQYVVKEIARQDIAKPSQRLVAFAQTVAGLEMINSFTVSELAEEAYKRFSGNS